MRSEFPGHADLAFVSPWLCKEFLLGDTLDKPLPSSPHTSQAHPRSPPCLELGWPLGGPGKWYRSAPDWQLDASAQGGFWFFQF